MVQRYEFIDNAPWENPTGKWVRQVDHAAELATLRAENERLRGALDRIADDKGDMIAPNWVVLIAKEALK